MRREAARAEILSCLDRVGIRPRRAQDFPHQLSGGERQRVMIAMALLTQPKLLIADEPTTALDVTVQAQILQLLRELQRELNMGMLFITHNPEHCASAGPSVTVMRNGREVEHNRCDALFRQPQQPYTRELLAAEPDGAPVPLNDAPPLLQVNNLQVGFPIRRGLLKRTVAEKPRYTISVLPCGAAKASG